MKILFCDNTLWGLINFRGDVIAHFVKRGNKVVLVAPKEEDAQMRANIPQGLTYIPIKMKRTSKNPLTNLSYFVKLLRIYKKEKPDYIFHYTIKPNIFGTIAARLLNIPSTAMMAGLGYSFINDNLATKLARTIYRFALHYTDHLMLLNEANKKMVIEKKFCSPNKIILLKGGEGVNLNAFPFYDNTSSSTTFLFIGRILYDKGYSEFVQAAQKVKQLYPNARFELLGSLDPSYPKNVPAKVLEKDERETGIVYRGFTDDMSSVYQEKGLVITLPSYTEGLNRTLMEACSTGKPIIASDIPGCSLMVDEGQNGYLVKPKDADSLSEACLKYLKLNAKEREDFSRHSRHIAEQRFSVENVIREYDKILKHI